MLPVLINSWVSFIQINILVLKYENMKVEQKQLIIKDPCVNNIYIKVRHLNI